MKLTLCDRCGAEGATGVFLKYRPFPEAVPDNDPRQYDSYDACEPCIDVLRELVKKWKEKT
jgi:hypothetical protein